VPLGVGHLLYRALVLRTQGVVRYSVATGSPSLLVLAGVVVLGAVGTTEGLAAVIALAAAVGCAVSAAWSGPALRIAPMPGSSQRVLWRVSLQTWVQAALAALLVALLLSLVRALGASLAEVGAVSLGLYVYQLFGVLAAYAAPVIYDRVAGSSSPAARWEVWRRWRTRALCVGVAAMVAALAGPRLVAIAWPATASHAASITCFAVAGLAALATRIGATLLQALGRLRELSVQAAWRLAAALILATALMQAFPASYAVPLALLGVELATVLRLMALLRRAPGVAAIAAGKGVA
jgi:hypothetical protein